MPRLILLALVCVLASMGVMGAGSTPPTGVSGDAELEDLRTIGQQHDHGAIAAYAWQDDFADAVARLREAYPGDFSDAEILGDSRAQVSFSGAVPVGARGDVTNFTDQFGDVSVSLQANVGWTDAELEALIPAIHFAIMEASDDIEDITTEFDPGTTTIKTTVVLASKADSAVLSGASGNGRHL